MNWQTKKLGEISTISSGATPSRMKPDYYSGGTIPWVKSGELVNGEINDTGEFITPQAATDMRLKILPKGTPILAMYGATAGTAAILNIKATTNQAVAAIQPDTNVLDPKYVFYFLKFKKSEFLGKRLGGAQPNISQKTIKTLKIPIPPLSIQQQIVERLDAIRKLQELNNKEIEKAEELFDSLLFESYENGEEWEKERLGDLCNEVYRYPTYYGIKYVEKGIPEVRGEMLSEDGEINLDTSAWRYIDENTASKYPRTKLIEGDILISVRGTIGKLGFVPKELEGGNITANLIRLSPNSDLISNKYLFYFLNTGHFRKKLQSISHNTTIQTLKAPDLKAIAVTIPEKNRQLLIVEELDNAKIYLKKLKVKRDKLSELFESTLNKAMKGELVN